MVTLLYVVTHSSTSSVPLPRVRYITKGEYKTNIAPSLGLSRNRCGGLRSAGKGITGEREGPVSNSGTRGHIGIEVALLGKPHPGPWLTENSV